jgi:2-polyprenyl-6-methoxyphenol hydroxylase-like FAD-dependent oxidoreductase
MLGTQIDYVDESAPAAVLVDGRRFTADLVVGADGTSWYLDFFR